MTVLAAERLAAGAERLAAGAERLAAGAERLAASGYYDWPPAKKLTSAPRLLLRQSGALFAPVTAVSDLDAKTNWEEAARQLVWHLRDERSQREHARWLGYASNVVWGWEAGRRFPSASQFLAICDRRGVEVVVVLKAFAPGCAGQLAGVSSGAEVAVGAWLDALRGTRPIAGLARSAGVSSHALRRWLRGRAQPRLPDFLRVVEAATGRVCELTRGLVFTGWWGQVRELAAHEQRRIARWRPG
jgi:X-X-X-Leu-X-X-Gly heptad repeat protein